MNLPFTREWTQSTLLGQIDKQGGANEFTANAQELSSPLNLLDFFSFGL